MPLSRNRDTGTWDYVQMFEDLRYIFSPVPSKVSFKQICYHAIYLTKNVAYKGIDFILLAIPKFFVEILIAYLGLYLFI